MARECLLIYGRLLLSLQSQRTILFEYLQSSHLFCGFLLLSATYFFPYIQLALLSAQFSTLFTSLKDIIILRGLQNLPKQLHGIWIFLRCQGWSNSLHTLNLSEISLSRDTVKRYCQFYWCVFEDVNISYIHKLGIVLYCDPFVDPEPVYSILALCRIFVPLDVMNNFVLHSKRIIQP